MLKLAAFESDTNNTNTPPLRLKVPESCDFVRKFGTAVDMSAFGGRLEVDWSPGDRVTSVGGHVFFATFLKETGLFDRLCERGFGSLVIRKDSK